MLRKNLHISLTVATKKGMIQPRRKFSDITISTLLSGGLAALVAYSSLGVWILTIQLKLSQKSIEKLDQSIGKVGMETKEEMKELMMESSNEMKELRMESKQSFDKLEVQIKDSDSRVDKVLMRYLDLQQRVPKSAGE